MQISTECSLSNIRPTNAKNTYAILDAVRRYPGRSLLSITDIVVKEAGGDKDFRRQIYATGQGLIRRNRIIRDAMTDGLTTTYTGTQAESKGG